MTFSKRGGDRTAVNAFGNHLTKDLATLLRQKETHLYLSKVY